MAGIFITSLLLWYEIDKANPILNQICTIGTKTNCNAILTGKQSKFLGIISWSEIGFFYFASGLLYVLFASNTTIVPTITIIALLNIVALPYTIFSIFYQWRIAKQWCPLCIAVQLLLIAEFATCLATKQHTNFINIEFTASTLLPLAILIPVIGWYILKPNFLNAQQNKATKKALMRLKYNIQIFNALLPKQPKVDHLTDDLGIIIGNPNAENLIVKVCNPYCGPCATAHPEIEALLENNPNVKAQIIFTATSNKEDRRSYPVKHLLAIAQQQNQQLTKQSLDDWYLTPKKDYELFKIKYPINETIEQQEDKINKMANWCKENTIQFTPTIFINGYQMPNVYTIQDLKYLLT